MMYKLYFFDLFFYKKIKKKRGIKSSKGGIKSSKGGIKSSKEKFKRKVQKGRFKRRKISFAYLNTVGFLYLMGCKNGFLEGPAIPN